MKTYSFKSLTLLILFLTLCNMNGFAKKSAEDPLNAELPKDQPDNTIESVNSNVVVIAYGALHTSKKYTIESGAHITLDGHDIGISDIKSGMVVQKNEGLETSITGLQLLGAEAAGAPSPGSASSKKSKKDDKKKKKSGA
jgi:hypothetical protein